jgi:DNA-binding response OmpR family regulator
MDVLIIGDDARSLELLAFIVRQGHWVPLAAYTLDKALAAQEKSPARLAVVEINSSVAESAALCQALKQKLLAPVIVISPWNDEASQLRLYEAGADDCILRPFSPRILEKKIRVFLRLSGGAPPATLSSLESGPVSLNPERLTVTIHSREPLRLGPLEFRLLYILLSNSGRVIPTNDLIDKVWGYGGEGSRDLLKGLVSRLRSKLEPDTRFPHYIRTVPGVGYSFSPTEDERKV